MNQLLQERVARTAQSRAQETAIVMGSERLTYGELEQRSNMLARLLIDQGVRRGDRVCLMQPKAPVAIVSMLATLKAGAVYIPVDIASPFARVEKIVTAADPRLLLASVHASELLAQLRVDARLISVDGALDGSQCSFADASAFEAAPLATITRPSDPAHILFTSGSTGVPKGVIITHEMVDAFLHWALPYFGHRPGDRISGHPPLHFDLSTFDIFGSLSSGAELHLVPGNVLLPNQLASFIRDAQLTQWFSVPSTFAYLARGDAVGEGDYPSLERIIWCGEVLPPAVLRHWMRRVPQCSYTNLYGPTEATIASSYYTVVSVPDDKTAAIPIGTPCAGEDIRVLDEALRPVPPGEIGELYIEGAGLSPGYWRDEEKTRAAFICDPVTGRRLYRTGDLGRRDADGLLHFVGRADSQIKSRGYRIELGEIETALTAVAGVAECAVVGVPSETFDGTAICCAWVSRPDAELNPTRLRSSLAEMLPTYMLPSRWLRLTELPKNANGKTDRPALRQRFAESSGP
ncbi:MAG: amino acid adenylation domain-containing protein [Solirubrobacterales bacterium]|nr:amino acid adenylation domain-containing protein [Solirubrobacterales bacterium]